MWTKVLLPGREVKAAQYLRLDLPAIDDVPIWSNAQARSFWRIEQAVFDPQRLANDGFVVPKRPDEVTGEREVSAGHTQMCGGRRGDLELAHCPDQTRKSGCLRNGDDLLCAEQAARFADV